jgi:hypothetical protein
MEAICSSETLVDTQWTTRHYIPEDGTLHYHKQQNLSKISVQIFLHRKAHPQVFMAGVYETMENLQHSMRLTPKCQSYSYTSVYDTQSWYSPLLCTCLLWFYDRYPPELIICYSLGLRTGAQPANSATSHKLGSCVILNCRRRNTIN